MTAEINVYLISEFLHMRWWLL